MSRVSILGVAGLLALGLFLLVTRGEKVREGSSAVAVEPAGVELTTERAELVLPTTSEKAASFPAAPPEESARRSVASEERSTISGRVVAPGGFPAQERASVAAEVYVGQVNRRGNTRYLSAPVAADGSFTLAVPEDTRYALLDLAGTSLQLSEEVRALPGQTDVILRPFVLAAVAGRLIAPPGATPPETEAAWSEVEVKWSIVNEAGSEVSIEDSKDEGFSYLRIQPDEQGQFEIPFLPIGVPLSLRVEHPFGPAQELLLDPLLAGERREVLVALDRGLTVAGRVLDEHGQPVADVRVSASLPLPDVFSSEFSREDVRFSSGVLKTDAEGRFFLAKLPRTRLEIAAGGEDLLDFGVAAVDGTAGDVHGLELHVTRGAPIEGTVTWPDGTQAQSFEVHALGPWGPSESAANGRFRLRVPAEEVYDIEVSASRGTVLGTTQAHGVRGGGASLALVLETKAAVEVNGTVVDEGGEPVEVFSVSWGVRSREARLLHESSTGRAGHFHLGGLSPGELSVAVRADGFRRSTQTLEIGELPSESLRFMLTRAGVVRGHVVDGEGRGVADANVSSEYEGARRRTTRDGSFEFVPEAPALRLVARKEGYAPSDVLELELVAGEIVDGVTLRLREGCRIEGRVIDAGGRPVAGARVEAEVQAPVVTDVSGAFVLQDLPAGPRTIVASPPGSSTQVVHARADPRPGRTFALELRFAEPDPVRLHGQIRRQGKPVACTLFLESPTCRTFAKVGPEGRFEITLARPDDFLGLICVEGPGFVETRRLELHVPDADEYDLDVDCDTLPRVGQ